MIVADAAFGRLGNQLELASHLIAFAELTGQTVCLKYLGRNARHFPYFERDFLNAYPRRESPGRALDHLAYMGIWALSRGRAIPTVDYLAGDRAVFFDAPEVQGDPEVSVLRSSRISVFRGWRFRARSASAETRRRIRDVFTPHASILERGEAQRSALACDIVIGVHMRRGDFKSAYPHLYFGPDTYRQRMHEARALFPGRKVGFIVCSDEPVPAVFDGLEYRVAGGDAIHDLYTLAQCDFIIATRSTFATWASYWGGKGLFLMTSDDDRIGSPDDFVPFDWQMPGWPPA